jgi:tetratricopeptide (TPR) repeat protein
VRRVVTLLLALPALLTAQDAQTAKAWINQGVQAFRSAQYQDAIGDFQRAASLSPNDATPHLYLGSTYIALRIPGTESPENAQNARAAEAEFQRVLELDPNNVTALSNLAQLSFNEANTLLDYLQASQKKVKLDQTRDLYLRLLQVDPKNPTAYYTLGVIAWMQVHPALLEARAQLGMPPEVPGPLRDPAIRQSLKTTYGFVIDDGISNLERALRLDPQYDDAMAYMNLLLRQRADLRDTAADSTADIASADQWLQQALEAKRAKTRPSAIVGGVTGAATPPPPPPPPPPARPIRVSGSVSQYQLVRRVEPVYPADARIQGDVRFDATIGTDGKIVKLQLLSGHPLLVPAAFDAVQQWIYHPTLLNNEPVEVMTEITVNFTLPPGN